MSPRDHADFDNGIPRLPPSRRGPLVKGAADEIWTRLRNIHRDLPLATDDAAVECAQELVEAYVEAGETAAHQMLTVIAEGLAGDQSKMRHAGAMMAIQSLSKQGPVHMGMTFSDEEDLLLWEITTCTAETGQATVARRNPCGNPRRRDEERLPVAISVGTLMAPVTAPALRYRVSEMHPWGLRALPYRRQGGEVALIKIHSGGRDVWAAGGGPPEARDSEWVVVGED